MRKKYVRVANAVLDLEQFGMDNRKMTEGNHESIWSHSDHNKIKVSPSPKVTSALMSLLDQELLYYCPDPSANELKVAIAEYTGLPLDYIGCYPGDYMSLDYISRTFLEPGTDMLISGQVYPEKMIPATSVGASVEEIHHENPFSPDLEAIINSIGKRTRMLYLGNPSETVGSFITEAELVFLTAYAENSMIVVDESYFEFSGFTVSDLVERFPNLAVIRSFSHAFGLAGLNIGYILTDPCNLERIDSLTGANTVGYISQIAALAALDDRDHLEKYISAVNRSKDLISSSLPGFGYEFYVSPANFILLRVSDTEAACRYLADNDFQVADFNSMRQLEGFVRIIIGTSDNTDRLLLVLSRIAEEIATGFNRARLNSVSAEPEPETPTVPRAK